MNVNNGKTQNSKPKKRVRAWKLFVAAAICYFFYNIIPSTAFPLDAIGEAFGLVGGITLVVAIVRLVQELKTSGKMKETSA